MSIQNDAKAAGLNDVYIKDNPSVGLEGDQSLEVAMATKMALTLAQPMSDITTMLVNEDFKGDFFKLGDSVSIVKPDPNSVKFEFGDINTGMIRAGNTGNVGTVGAIKDRRLQCTYAEFSKTILTIDKYAKYAFAISDITKEEGKWNYESGNLELEAYNIRTGHNLLTTQSLIDDAAAGINENDVQKKKNHVRTIGTPAAPVVITKPDELYTKVVIPARSRLYSAGAITADGQISYGSNPQQTKATRGAIFIPEALYNLALQSDFSTLGRGTELADRRVESGEVGERIMGLHLGIEPALDPSNPELTHKVTLPSDAVEGVVAVVVGTRNAVTRAGKVLTPDKFDSHDRFAVEFHGMEIYGETIVEPKAAVVAFVKVQLA